MKEKGSKKRLALHMLPGSLLIDADFTGGRWYECAPVWPSADAITTENEKKGEEKGKNSKLNEGKRLVSTDEWLEVAEAALSAVSRAFQKRGKNERTMNGEGRHMLNSITEKGTAADKIAAVTLKVQESPVHRLDELQSLFQFTEKKGRRERGLAIDALNDLLVNDLLPNDRRLIPFAERDFGTHPKKITKRHVAYALFESELKSLYGRFLETLVSCSHDTVGYFKQKAVRVIFNLLRAKPENEKELLATLVNKLGDPDRKIASTVSFDLTQLIHKHHPAMKMIVVKEVDEFLHRANLSQRAQYYALTFLSQIRFSKGKDDTELTRELLRVYLSTFTSLVKQDLDAKSLSRPGSTKARETRLMGVVLTGINRAFPYSKAEDDDDVHYDKEYDALFKVAHSRSLLSATQSLNFLFRVAQSRKAVSDRYYRALYERINDAGAASEKKQAMLMNLIVRSMKADVSVSRIRAFAKRMLQSAFFSTPGYAAGVLLVISEVLVHHRKGMLRSAVAFSEVDEDMALKSPVEQGSEVYNKQASQSLDDKWKKIKERGEGSLPSQNAVNQLLRSHYDPDKRDPQYAGAEQSCFWELVALGSHYHPSVSKFAKQLLCDLTRLKYPGDPLKDFGEGAFLDRFCYRKPKKRVTESLHGRRSARLKGRPLVNSEAFLNMGATGQVPVDDEFFLKYFQTKSSNNRKLPVQEYDSADELEEAFEEAIKKEMRRLGGGEGLSTNGSEVGADVDEEDPDELRALEGAFENGFLSDTNSDSTEDQLTEYGAISGAKMGTKGAAKEETKRSTSRSSFAPADEYAEIPKGESSASGKQESSDGQEGAHKYKPEFSQNGFADCGRPKKRRASSNVAHITNNRRKIRKRRTRTKQ